MVKGITRQVIVVHSPDPKLFDQAIFILKDEAVGKGITDEALLKEAQQIVRPTAGKKQRCLGPLWACGGGAAMGLAWLISVLL